MRILVNAKQQVPGTWLATLSEPELDTLGTPAVTQGSTSLVLLQTAPQTRAGELVLDTEQASLLNRGETASTVLMVASPEETSQPTGSSPVSSNVGGEMPSGDSQYIEELPSDLRMLGQRLLEEVRRRWPGNLQPTQAGRYVETPDNFWTVRIQPRDVSLRITVRGEAKSFPHLPHLELKDDRRGYSTFKMRTIEDVSDALSVLERARRRS